VARGGRRLRTLRTSKVPRASWIALILIVLLCTEAYGQPQGQEGAALSEAGKLARQAAAHADGGRVDRALAVAAEAERLATADRDYLTLSDVERARAVVARFRGETLASIDHAREAARHARRAGDRAALSAALAQVASGFQTLGDWSRTLDFAQQAYDALPQPTDGIRASYLMQRGIVLHEMREGREAIAAFEEAREIARRNGDARTVGFAELEIGLTRWLVEHQPDDGLRHFEEALTWINRAGAVTLLPPLYNNWGAALRDLERYDEALAKFRSGLAIQPGGSPNSTAAILTKNLGQTLALAGRPHEAVPVLLEAVALADRLNSPNARWQARMELGMLFATADPDRADRHFAESIELLEANSSNLLLERFRAGAFGSWLNKYDPFDRYIDLLLARGEPDRAFGVAERARARAFLDTLSAAREQLASVVPAAFTHDENAVLAEISGLQAGLRSPALAAAERTDRARRVVAAEERLAALRLRLAAEHPSLAHARYPALASAGDVARQLEHGERMVMFYVGTGQTTAWVVSPEGAHTVRLPPRAALTPLARRYIEALKLPAADLRAPARALHDALAPALDLLPAGGRLVIVPHGILSYLPFEALIAGDGTYLTERHVISYVPSASSFAFLRQAPAQTPASPAVVAIGNPPAPAGSGSAARRDASLRQVAYLRPLVWARQELREIASIFGGHARVLHGQNATERALAAAGIERAAILHFATHGLIDEAKPERSALTLAARPPHEDGILQVREIYQWRLRAALVTLSACDTALGREVAGEGLFSLSRAFFAAGASAVLASLWSVDDESTAFFMRHFYREVRAGADIDAAARDARLTMIREGGRHAHPYYWSPFIVSGHAARPIGFPARAIAGVQTVVPPAAVIVLAAILLFRRRRG
jgi:CHAT domain-containing protein